MDKLGDQLGQAVRPTIALIFAIGACVAFFMGKLNSDQWLGLATMAISFYFATKTAETASRRAPNRASDIQNVEGNVNVQSAVVPSRVAPTTTTRRRRT